MKHPTSESWGNDPVFLPIVWSLLVALCLLVFNPHLPNTNLPKELIWWIALPLMLGLWMIAASNPEHSSSLKKALEPIRANKPLFILWCIWIAWCGISVLRSLDTLRAFALWGRQIGYLLTAAGFALVFANLRSLFRLLRILTIVLGIVGFYTTLQFFHLDFFRWTDMRRPPGTFGNPNFTANLLASFLPLVILSELFLFHPVGEKPKDRPFSKGILILKRIPWCGLLVLSGLLTTQSRGGFIALLVGMTLLAFLLPRASVRFNREAGETGRQYKKNGIRIALILVLFVEVLVAILIWKAPDRLEHLLSSSTVQMRWELWKGSWQLWRESPLMGWGLGSFQTISPRIGYWIESITVNQHAVHAHSWIVELLVELGLLGAVAFLSMIGWVFGKTFRAILRHPDRSERLILTGTLSGMAALLSGTAVGVWLNWWGGGWILWMLIGMAASRTANVTPIHSVAPTVTPHEKRPPLLLVRILGLLLISTSILLGILSWNFYRSELHLHRVRFLVEQGKFSEAIPILDRIQTLTPHSPDLSYWMALCLMNTGGVDRSVEELETVLKARPWDYRSHYLLGEAYRILGRPDLAVESFRQTYELETTGRMAVEWGNALLLQHRVDEARQVLERHLARSVHLPALRLYLQIQTETGHLDEARDCLRRLHSNASSRVRVEDRVSLYQWEAELSSLLDDPVAAAEAYRSALRIDSQNFQIWNDYGLSLKRIRQLQRAAAAFDRAIQLNPTHYAPRMNRLELAIERHDTETARRIAGSLRAFPLPVEVRKRLDTVERDLNPETAPATPTHP